MKLILASASPRRKEILIKNGFSFEIVKSDVEEKNLPSALETAKNNALLKAKDVFDKLKDEKVVVLGADTVVVIDDKILGKPKTEKDAENMLKTLSNRTHQVITGYAIVSKNQTINDYDISEVTFNDLSSEVISEYIKTGSPMDKAGAYGIQDGFPLLKELKGSLDNVIGLPIEKIKKVLINALVF